MKKKTSLEVKIQSIKFLEIIKLKIVNFMSQISILEHRSKWTEPKIISIVWKMVIRGKWFPVIFCFSGAGFHMNLMKGFLTKAIDVKHSNSFGIRSTKISLKGANFFFSFKFYFC